MERLISARLAGNLMLIALGLLAVLHVLILLKVVPAGIVWGGQAANAPANLVTLELVALVVTGLMALIMAVLTLRLALEK